MISDVGHLFMSLLAICMSFWRNVYLGLQEWFYTLIAVFNLSENDCILMFENMRNFQTIQSFNVKFVVMLAP